MEMREEVPKSFETSEEWTVQDSGPDELDPKVQEERSIKLIEEIEDVTLHVTMVASWNDDWPCKPT